MTHPLREPKKDGSRRRVKKGEPFDPEDLSRRLTAHLAEQKLKAERRHARAKAAAAQQIYHHVPKVAAADFERTATPVDTMRQVHKLSQPALKQRLENLSLDDPNPQATSLHRTQALDQAVVERDLLRNRNQFQWTHDMEEAAEVDMDRDVYKLPQRTFHSEIARKSRHEKALSTGALFSDEDEPTVNTDKKPKPKPKPIFDGRNDWAQREEDHHNRKGVVKEQSNPALKKKDSIWLLGSRKEKSSKKQNKEEASTGSGEFGSSPDGIKGAKLGFLARFKRHPS
jgi:hypothetical protein